MIYFMYICHPSSTICTLALHGIPEGGLFFLMCCDHTVYNKCIVMAPIHETVFIKQHYNMKVMNEKVQLLYTNNWQYTKPDKMWAVGSSRLIVILHLGRVVDQSRCLLLWWAWFQSVWGGDGWEECSRFDTQPCTCPYHQSPPPVGMHTVHALSVEYHTLHNITLHKYIHKFPDQIFSLFNYRCYEKFSQWNWVTWNLQAIAIWLMCYDTVYDVRQNN